jgi:proteasome lid subunit RPN8/RPN11
VSHGARLSLPPAVRRAIAAHARDAYPAECCGFLVGRPGRIDFAVRMRNLAPSARRYRIDDRAHIEVRKVLRSFEPLLEIVGVYHSHPDGTVAPSDTDCAEAHYPGWVHVIVAFDGRRIRFGAFRIGGGRSHRLVLG